MRDTRDIAYKDRLQAADSWWKRLLDVQRPYRNNLARLEPGFVLDIGCGIGRNLKNLQDVGVKAVGVDHNTHSVEVACRHGYDAYDTDGFESAFGGKTAIFDSLLVSHVLEHMTMDEAGALLQAYLPLLKPGGRVVSITPQERGFASDPTHIEFMTFEKVSAVMTPLGLTVERFYSFPLPRLVGRWFTHNEFIVIGKKP